MILPIFFLVIFLLLPAGLILFHQLLQQETAVIQLTGEVADLAVLILTQAQMAATVPAMPQTASTSVGVGSRWS